MLYSERKRLAQLAKRESSGESVWTLNIPQALREKLIRLISTYAILVNQFSASIGLEDLLTTARSIILRETGKTTLRGSSSAVNDFVSLIRNGDSDEFPDIFESLVRALESSIHNKAKQVSAITNFEEDINELLESYRIAYSIENKEVISFTSRELHITVIVPALRLLTQSGWETVEKAYQDSLKELASGKPDNAITDATTALQEGLRKMGCKGDNFADLLKSAKNTILKGYDSKYIDAIDSLISWASATRSNKGDSHKVTNAEKDDAWFVIHLVGILLLRLSRFEGS